MWCMAVFGNGLILLNVMKLDIQLIIRLFSLFYVKNLVFRLFRLILILIWNYRVGLSIG